MTATAQDRETARKLFDELFVIAAPVRIEHLAAALTAARQEERERIAKVWDVDPRDTDQAMYSGPHIAAVIRRRHDW